MKETLSGKLEEVVLLAKASPRRGGKKKRYFYVSKQGLKALTEVKRIRESFWKLVPITKLEGGLS